VENAEDQKRLLQRLERGIPARNSGVARARATINWESPALADGIYRQAHTYTWHPYAGGAISYAYGTHMLVVQSHMYIVLHTYASGHIAHLHMTPRHMHQHINAARDTPALRCARRCLCNVYGKRAFCKHVCVDLMQRGIMVPPLLFTADDDDGVLAFGGSARPGRPLLHHPGQFRK